MGMSENSAGCADDEPADELPEIPPEWGPIVIPDDPAELAAEAEQVRRELQQQARQRGNRRRPTSRLPLLVLLTGVLLTLISLLAALWSGQPDNTRTPAADPPDVPPATIATGQLVPALDLVDEQGRPVALRSLLPAVIITVDGCPCTDTLRQAASTVPPGVTVLALSSTGRRPSPPPAQSTPGEGRIRSLTDPTAELRTFLQLPDPSPRPVAVLVARSGRVVQVLPDPAALAGHPAELAQLTAS